MTISFVTNNDDKFKEFYDFIPNLAKVSIDLPEIQSLDPKEVIRDKLNKATQQVEGPIVVEDTSLVLNCLNELPGTFIKFFERSIDLTGIYNLCLNYNDFGATAITTIGYKNTNGNFEFYTGKINGLIVEPKGDNGFGWDKIFIADGLDKTFAELDGNTKLFYSMRTAALVKLVNALHVI